VAAFALLLAACATRTQPPGPPAAPVPLFNNLGRHHHGITTKSPDAQRYFDQGLRLMYAFNHDEAIRSFEQAARLDPDCAMAYWGIAFAHGPNYNMPRDGTRDRAAYAAVQRALELSPKASLREQAYITAIAKRYSNDPNADPRQLDAAFADAMRLLSRRFPDDLDATTIFAESMMDLRPWDLWTADGKPQPGTPEIIIALESVLRRNPEHPGANHYYIHAVEASPRPERGLSSAERLGSLMPGAGHLVHMPSHIYIRTGRYAAAAESNRRAIAVDRAYLEKAKPQGVYPMMYVPHNIHFLWAAASMEGRSAEALQAARDLEKAVDIEMVRHMPPIEFFVPTPYFALVRFGKWEEMLREPAPPQDLVHATALWWYARGVALLGTGRIDEAVEAQRQVAAAEAAMPPDRVVDVITPAKQILAVASMALSGEIAARRGDTAEAVKLLQKAIESEDQLPYSEPAGWYYPVRQSLGAVLLKAGRSAEAVDVYREDLRRNPRNGWSLFGLAQALRARGKRDEAQRAESDFRAAWARADVKLTASRF
jgi:tetratricopeptide (TPR) repeat protein